LHQRSSSYSTHIVLISLSLFAFLSLFFCNDPAPPEIYTLSLHDALPILRQIGWDFASRARGWPIRAAPTSSRMLRRSASCRCRQDRKSTRLNSSHRTISYAVFCLKKKNKIKTNNNTVDTYYAVRRAQVSS